jgi:hypothetical protein
MENHRVKATVDGQTYFAYHKALDQWVFGPEPLAIYASEADIPDAIVVYGGTMVQRLDLYSADPNTAIFAAYWVIESYLESVGADPTQIEWKVEGLDPEPADIPDRVY